MLEIKALSAWYGTRFPVLHQVSLRVDPGEIVGVFGPNGAGKTTIMRAVMGLMPRIEGEIRIGEKAMSVVGRSTHGIARAGVAYVEEGRGIVNSLSVQENLEVAAHLGRRRSGRPVTELIENAIDAFPVLRKKIRHGAGTLSGGEQQMLAIARGVVLQPEVLLLDEPSLGLAPIIIGELAELVREIARQRSLSVLVVEQNIGFVAQTCSRAYALQLGKVVAEDDIETLISGDSDAVAALYFGRADEDDEKSEEREIRGWIS